MMKEETIEPNHDVFKHFPELATKWEKFLLTTYNKNESVNFKRAIVTYTHMTSPFLCPVWDTKEKGKKLILVSPYLTPLREILRRDHRDYRFLHTVFYPIAMAIDTLHTVVPGRSYFFHRAICLDNVVMPEWKHSDKERNSEIVYGNARLKVSDLTKLIFSIISSENSLPLQKYYHYPLAKLQACYTKEEDWYSYGVFVIEVLFEMFIKLNEDSRLEKYQPFEENDCFDDFFRKYSEVLTVMKAICREKKDERIGDIPVIQILTYLDVAEMCISAASENKEIESVSELTLNGINNAIFFEYEVSKVAALLFELYRGHGKANLKKYHSPNVNKKTCQSCLLRASVNIPTRTFRCENHDRGEICCDLYKRNPCTYYCNECYRNKERKFCPVHGTASKFLGHTFSYALILFGEEFDINCKIDFGEDANRIANLLMQQRVHGMSAENVIVQGLNEGEPLQLFKDAVKRMKKLIHKRNYQGKCKNSHKYQLFIYYSGNGGDSEKESGVWQPVKQKKIPKETIQEELMKIRKCSACQDKGSCEQIIWFMDHCFPGDQFGNKFLTGRNTEDLSCLVIQVYKDEGSFYGLNGSFLTNHVCDFSLGNVPKKKDDTTDSSKQPDLILGNDIPANITVSKFCQVGTEQTKIIVHANKGKHYYALAYRNADEVKYTVHDLDRVTKSHDLDAFSESLTLAQVERKIKELEKLNESDTVLLLTNLTRDCTKHALIWDHELKHILERGLIKDGFSFHALVYYKVIPKDDQLEIELKWNGLDSGISLMLPVSRNELCLLTGMDARERRRTNFLPNILEYVVYQLYRICLNEESMANSDNLITDNEKLVYESFIRKIDSRCQTFPPISAHDQWKDLGIATAKAKLKVDLQGECEDSNSVDYAFVFHGQTQRYCLEWKDDDINFVIDIENGLPLSATKKSRGVTKQFFDSLCCLRTSSHK